MFVLHLICIFAREHSTEFIVVPEMVYAVLELLHRMFQ